MWSPLWSILAWKIPQFGQKLPIRITHHTFLESGHPEVTKNAYYDLFPEGSQRKVSTHGLKNLKETYLNRVFKKCTI